MVVYHIPMNEMLSLERANKMDTDLMPEGLNYMRGANDNSL
jgi:hypothetical protein